MHLAHVSVSNSGLLFMQLSIVDTKRCAQELQSTLALRGRHSGEHP